MHSFCRVPVSRTPSPLSWNFTLRLRFLVVALGLAAEDAAHAAVPAGAGDYAVREWHMQDGLPSDQITRINQDGDGYLWVATTSGMARFDGTHFTAHPLTAETSSYTRVTATTSAGRVVAAPFFRRGLVALQDGAFRPWEPAVFQDRVVNALFTEPAGALWAACDDGTVLRHENGQTKVFDVDDGLPRARVRTFARDAGGQVWIASDGYVARHQDGELVPLADNFDGSELRIGSSETGGPWLVTRDRLLRIEGERAIERAALPALLGAHYVQALEENRDGTLWIGTRSQGLHVLAGGEIRQVPTTHEDVFSLCEDREGNMWVGTNGGGLYRVRRKTYRLYDKSAGLRDNFTFTLMEDAQGDIWLANRDGGVARVRDGAVDVLAERPGWLRMSAMSIFQGAPGRLAVTSGSGVYEFADERSLALRRIEALPAFGSIRATFVARNGDVWLSLDPNRVARLRKDKVDTFGPAEGFHGRQVRGMAEDARGGILLGTSDGRLLRFADGKFDPIPLGGVATGAIQAIRIARDGEIWLGTVDAGIVALRRGKVAVCDARHGLPDSNITQIVPDGHGYLWFGSKRGIFRLGEKELIDCLDGKAARLSPLVAGHDEGLKDISCQGLYQPAALRARDGKLWFATRRGVVVIDPTVQLAAPPPPLVAVEEVRLDDRPVPLRRPFEVDGRVRKLEIRFGVLNLSAPERVHAKYRLDGFDADWVIAPPGRTATYPRLPPAQYRFRVMASVGDGAANELGDAVTFTVEPRWWQTAWFRIAAVTAAALGVAGMVRAWSHRRLRRRLEKLEREGAIERERTRIAQNIHDDLGASLTRISLLTQHARHENSSSAGYFDQIHRTASDITRTMDEIVWAVNPKYDDVENLAGYLGNFAQGFLSVAGIRCRLDVPDQFPHIALTSQTRHHLFLCCKETLNNVVKHAGADEVSISFAVRGPNLVLAIADNGRGYDARVPAGRGNGEIRAASGTGLESLRRRMTELGGQCDIHSTVGRGSTVTFTVPLGLPAN